MSHPLENRIFKRYSQSFKKTEMVRFDAPNVESLTDASVDGWLLVPR